MKKTVILLAILSALVLPAMAQGNGKIKHKKVDVSKKLKQAKDKSERQKHENGIWEGTKDNDGGGPKASKNQPAKVRAAFLRDYPGAGSVSWSKYRGDWTATFRNGPFWSTAVYHANGDRRDTRTQMPKEQVPVKILDIFKKRPETRVEDAVKIEVPKTVSDIFRIKSILGGTAKFQFFDTNGNEVQYNY
jgi:hypothetical protein